MNPKPTDLVQDPLFQLNVLLWLAQPLPEKSDIRPVLHQQGFSVYAIAPALPVPLDLRLAAQRANIAVQESVRPDVVLAREKDRQFVFTECKASSFGPASATAEQAGAFLLVAGPRAPEVLGLTPAQVGDSLLAYLTPDSQRAALNATLTQLADTLARQQLPPGRFCLWGLSVTPTDLTVVMDRTGSDYVSLPEGSHRVMPLQPDTDPRPLYFIPYDPDVDLSPPERAFCRRVLFERIHSSVLVAVGRATPPADLLLDCNGLLNDAMFGMYALWENRDSARHMRELCRQLMKSLSQAINSVAAGAVAYDPVTGWKVSLPTPEQRNKVIDGVSRFSCETLNLGAEAERDLFENP